MANRHSNPTAINMQSHVEREQTKRHKIGPVKKGALHAELHLPQGQHIPASTLQREKAVAKRTHNTTLMKRVQFALNFAH
jgi:hypothetical protein